MKKEKLEFLKHEHEIINKKIDDFINDQFKYMTTLITMSAGFIYFAYGDGKRIEPFNEALQYLPYLLIIIGPTFLFKFHRAIMLHGYRHFLEEKINEILGKNILVGGLLAKENFMDKNPFAKFNYIVLFGFFITSIVICHGFSGEGNSFNLTKVFNVNGIIQLVILFGGIIKFVIENGRGFKKGYKFAKKCYEQLDTSFFDETHDKFVKII